MAAAPAEFEGFTWIREHGRKYGAKINQNSKFKMIGEVRDVIASLGQEAVDDIRQSAFGRLLDFDNHARLSGVILHQIIARQFTFRGIGHHEAWFHIGNESICFGKKEFCLITELKFGTSDFNPNMVYTPREDGLWKKVFKGAQILPKHLWDMMTMGQFNINLRLQCKLPSSYWQNWSLCLAMYEAMFDPRFGNSLMIGLCGINSLGIQSPPPPPKRKTVDKVNYNFYGFPITIQVWAYEAIKELGDEYSVAPKKSDLLPRFCRWKLPKYSIELGDFFDRPLNCSRFLSPSNEEASMPYWANIDDDINSGT
ncbi:hypothetical protein PTKIN_Ptkin15bG0180700 [Pterospermum kingtungense]